MGLRVRLGRSARVAACLALLLGGAPTGTLAAPPTSGSSEGAGQWTAPGRDAAGTYYSPLRLINDRNANRLGYAWQYHLDTRRGLEATPLVVGGLLITSGNWGKVYALDARTGKERWTYDPQVNGQWGRYACCDVVNRGVVERNGVVYVASLDGYLHALDVRSGRLRWKVDTLESRARDHYAVTGAPLLAGDLIVIGHGGADFESTRGSLSAYDVGTGALRWRLYTVPRDPALGDQDQPHLAAALTTWAQDYDWRHGGGGTVWDGLAYDPVRKLVYAGTGNAAPYRVEHGHHDELYTASILAIDAATGRLAWHYQTSPGDGWDYDASAKFILSDLAFADRSRPVLMQANKNGFLYVLDRGTGELLAAHRYAEVTWTAGIEGNPGRPTVLAEADWTETPRRIAPGPPGAHNWQPMAYNPVTKLVYVPTIEAPMIYINAAGRRVGSSDGAFEMATLPAAAYDPAELAPLFGALPQKESITNIADGPPHGVLRAMDPVSGRIVWERPGSDFFDGGVLTTAGNLVVRGDIAGRLNVYAADSGTLLQQIEVGTSIMAAPMTYRIGGEQFIAVMAGFGGGPMGGPFPADSAAARYGNAGRIVVFRLGGSRVPLPDPVVTAAIGAPSRPRPVGKSVADGEILYGRHCGRCHGFGPGLLPDLRRMTPAIDMAFDDIVLRGLLQPNGMPRWDDLLSEPDVHAIHDFITEQAWQAAEAK